MQKRTVLRMAAAGAVGAGFFWVLKPKKRFGYQDGIGTPARLGIGAAAGSLLAMAAESLSKIPQKIATMEDLMPKVEVHFSLPHVAKPTPTDLFINKGSGTDFESRPSAWGGFVTSNDRFYVRSHSPTPKIDVSTWRLRIDATGVQNATELTYEDLQRMPQVTLTRTMECAGNGRRFYKEHFGVEGEGGQWRTGAMGNAEWTGVRLRDVLARAGIKPTALDVMPVGLDDHEVRRPMPVDKALQDDTLLVLEMNGETLPADHGFPARVIATGWTGIANIKWVGRIQVSEEPLYSPYNTMEYILVGPNYPMGYPAMGPAITEMPVMSVLDLDWPAELEAAETTEILGRSYAGESRVREVVYSINGTPWQTAELFGPNLEGCWRQWKFPWKPKPGKHEIRVRATDERGRTQPDSVPWNHHGYLYNAIVAHPVIAV